MEEKIIIKGTAEELKTIPIVLIILGLILGVGVSYWITEVASEEYMLPFTISGGAVLLIWGIVLFFYVRKCEIGVTNKRIYGKAAFGTRITLPIDRISAVGTTRLLKGIFVSSPSGNIKFFYISNAEKIYTIICNILINRKI